MLQQFSNTIKCQWGCSNKMGLYKWVWTTVEQHLELRQNMMGGSSYSGSNKREHALISCTGYDPGLPCTVPHGYCRAFAILFPIFTSSVLPTTANGKWLYGAEGKRCCYPAKHLCTFSPSSYHQLSKLHQNSPSKLHICMWQLSQKTP